MKLMKDKIFTCSIVVYENDEEKLRQAIQSFLEITLFSKLYIIDNSPTDFLQKKTCNGMQNSKIFLPC
jgi:hypothetical protein